MSQRLRFPPPLPADGEQRFEALFERTLDAVFFIDLGGRILAANRRAEALLGIPRSDLVGRDALAFVAEDQQSASRDVMRRLLAGEPVPAYERLFVTADNRRIPVELSVTVVQDPAGRSLYFQSIARDISRRKQAENALRLVVEGVSGTTGRPFFRALVRHLATAMDARCALVATPTGPSASRVRTLAFWLEDRHAPDFEYDLEGTPCETVVAGEVVFVPEGVQAAYPDDRDLADLQAESYLGVPLAGPDGTVLGHLAVLDDAPIARDPRREWILQVFAARGAAELQRMRDEERLLNARKLESVGLLAGGIAHDFNNLLMGILGNLSLARLQSPEGGTAHARIEAAERAALRATGLTRQLLTFAKGGAPVRRSTSIGHQIRETAEFVLSGSAVAAEFEIPDDLWPVDVDPRQFSQVVENLVVNAVQAMPGGGLLRVRVANVALPRGAPLPLDPGRYVSVRVRDEGPGIPEGIRDRIFDPYFSTKERGSGLGLATCHAIVRKHDGHIAVQSERGQGATFTVYVPAADAPPEPEPDARRDPADAFPGRVVLVLDDDPDVREVAEQLLTHLGCDVTAVADGAAAMRACREARERGRPFHAAILDLTVPGGLGGRDVIGPLRQLDPALRVLVSSGYSDDPILAAYREYGFHGTLAKPYTLAGLRGALAGLFRTGAAGDGPPDDDSNAGSR